MVVVGVTSIQSSGAHAQTNTESDASAVICYYELGGIVYAIPNCAVDDIAFISAIVHLGMLCWKANDITVASSIRHAE